MVDDGKFDPEIGSIVGLMLSHRKVRNAERHVTRCYNVHHRDAKPF